MILVDTNLLIYAVDPTTPEHEAANAWLAAALAGPGRVGLPWESAMAFVRVATNPRMVRQPVTIAEAWEQIQRWLSSPVAWVPGPTPDHDALLKRLLATPGLGSNDVPDVQLAAIALGHGLEIKSHDAGFARFEGLRFSDPLRDH